MKKSVTPGKMLFVTVIIAATVRPMAIMTYAEPMEPQASDLAVRSKPVFPGHSIPEAKAFSWREILNGRPSGMCRVRFQIESTGSSVDEQLMIAGRNRFDAIILEPAQSTTEESRRRFEVAIVGNARVAIERLGLSSCDFRDQWIEVTGFPRHFSERRTDGDVAVSQFVVSDIESLEIHSSNWSGSAF